MYYCYIIRQVSVISKKSKNQEHETLNNYKVVFVAIFSFKRDLGNVSSYLR